MIQDRALRVLIVAWLVMLAAALGLTQIGWLIMGVGMSGGMNERLPGPVGTDRRRRRPRVAGPSLRGSPR